MSASARPETGLQGGRGSCPTQQNVADLARSSHLVAVAPPYSFSRDRRTCSADYPKACEDGVGHRPGVSRTMSEDLPRRPGSCSSVPQPLVRAHQRRRMGMAKLLKATIAM